MDESLSDSAPVPVTYLLSRRTILPIIAGLLIAWSLTGTLAPYAASLDRPRIAGPCKYLFNIDHPHFRATFDMLDGAPSENWSWSVVLRRVAYPLAAFPAMKVFGFEAGGLITNALMYLLGALWIARCLLARYGETAARYGQWIFATYPGIAYWFGVPYSYALIPLASVAAALLVTSLDARSERIPWRKMLVLGLLGLVHDTVAIIYGLAVAIFMVLRRDPAIYIAWCIFICVLPLAAFAAITDIPHDSTGINANTAYYALVPLSYLSNIFDARILTQLTDLPRSLISAIFYSNFLFLPLLAIGGAALAGILGGAAEQDTARRELLKTRPTRSEYCIFTAGFLFFLFINLAPMYNVPFTLRGSGYARFYQPLCGVFLLWFVRMLQTANTTDTQQLWRYLRGGAVGVIVLNASIPLAVWFWPAYSAFFFDAFYINGAPGAYERNIERFGKHPWGASGCGWTVTGRPGFAGEGRIP